MRHGYILADATTGRIFSIRYPTGNMPTSGVTDDGVYRNIILTDANLPNEDCLNFDYFVMNYYYHEPTGTFVYTGLPVNEHASWDFSTSSWAWDASKVTKEIKAKRNALLTNSDWAVLPDAPFTDSEVTEIKAYRQTLRDFPSTVSGNPATTGDVTWPTKPSCLG
jgi:hypothetical protein